MNLGEKLINIWHNATIKIIGINVLFYRLFIFNRQLAVFIILINSPGQRSWKLLLSLGICCPSSVMLHLLTYVYFSHIYFHILTSVDAEMCCPKGKCGCQYFISLTLKKKKIMDTGVLDIFNKKTNPGLLFLLKVQSCVFISNFHHSPPPPPKGY